MATRKSTGRWLFWALLALLWLPAGVVAMSVVRFGADGGPAAEPGMGLAAVPMMAGSLVPVSPCGLPRVVGCRRLWWLGYRRGAWMVRIGLGAVTVAASLVAGLLGPVAIAVYAVVLSCRCGLCGTGWCGGGERSRRRVGCAAGSRGEWSCGRTAGRLRVIGNRRFA